MEKTNELNKLLSYIHMGNSIYRIYYEEAKELKDQILIDLIIETQEIFKQHEEKITSMITQMNEKATDSLTAAGIMGVYKEKMKSFDNPFLIYTSVIKSTYMGMLSTFKFLNENKELPKHIVRYVKEMLVDYQDILYKFQNSLLDLF